jgi:hypothetical protein
MKFLSLTLEDGQAFLIRLDLVQQVRPFKDGAAIWFPTGVTAVRETVDEISALLKET